MNKTREIMSIVAVTSAAESLYCQVFFQTLFGPDRRIR